jgi:sugar phosphate isomerase/epimerase
MKLGVTMSTMPTEKRPATFGDGRVSRHLTAVKALGYHGVDLFIKPLPEAELRALEEAFRANGLEVAVIFPILLFEGGWSLSDPDRERRLEAVRLYKTQIELAARLRSRIVLGLARGNPLGGEPASAYERRLAESMQDMAVHALARGVEIVMEPVHRYLISTFNRVDQSLEFLERHGLSPVKLLLDTFHMNIEEPSIEGAIRLAGERIGHVHAVDSNRGAPGDGHLDFDSIVAALLETGYDGYLSVETQPEPDPYACAARAAGALGGVLRRLGLPDA